MSNYLDRALTGLRTLGINLLQPVPDAPVLVLLDRVAQYDTAKVTAIAAVLQQSTTFNSVVREQIAGMDISTRFMDITQSFTSIREDAAAMAGWMDDGRLDTLEKLKLSWMNLRRGSIPSRFNEIRENYLQVCKSANDQISRETVLEQRTQALNEANAQVTAAETLAPAERAALELRRDEAVRALQDEDKRYQIVKDIADDLKVGYNTAEMVFARINQVHVIKERQYQRMVSFFSTNEVVLTGLAVSFTSNSGLAEATNTLNATTDGISKGLEALGST
eukprot:gene13148-16045_t